VTASFPYKEQVELYRKALRFENVQDMFQRGLHPQIAGLNVSRREVDLAKNTASEWQTVYLQKDGTLTMSPAVKSLLTDAAYDTEHVAQLGHVRSPGGVSPLVKLAHRPYPKLELEGFPSGEPEKTAAAGEPTGDSGTPPPKASSILPFQGKGRTPPGA